MMEINLKKLMISLVVVLVSFGLRPSLVYSQSLNLGKSLYKKGDISGAENALKKALSGTGNKAEKAKISLMLGIVLYTKGDQSGSASQFKAALANDPKLEINPQDALDPSVLNLFKKVKSEFPVVSPQQPSTKPTQVSDRTPIAPGAKPIKKTLLKILSSVSEAQVSIDGILAGSVNELINTEPGTVVVEVSAAGYQTIRTQIKIIENQENIVSMTLEKEKPKAKAQATAPAEEQEADSFSPIPVPKTPSKSKKPGKISQNQKQKSSKDDLFDAPEPSPPPPKPKKKGRDLAREFEMDAATSMPAPYPMQQAPYPPQGYGYAYPQPPPNYQPPSYPPPMYDSKEQGYEEGPGYPSAPRPGGYARNGPPQSSVTLTSLLPLGIGQMTQKRYLLGGLFLASQIGLGYMAFDLSKQNEAFADSVNAYLAENCTPTGNIKRSDEEITACSDYETRSEGYLKDKRGEQQLYLVGAVLVGIVGISEAMIWDLNGHGSGVGSPPRKKKSKSTRPPKYRGFSLKVPRIRQSSPAQLSKRHKPDFSMYSHEKFPPLALEWRWAF
jgi:hypothetical protein